MTDSQIEYDYTLLAYKSDSVDTCRGCVMASYESSFIHDDDLTLKELKRQLTELMLHNLERSYGECSYDDEDIIILKNGIRLVHPKKQLLDDAKRSAEDLLKQKKAAADEKAKLEKQSRKREKDARDLAEFRRLQKKFKGGTK